MVTVSRVTMAFGMEMSRAEFQTRRYADVCPDAQGGLVGARANRAKRCATNPWNV